MKTIPKRTLILTSIIILLPMFIGLILWKRLPERMPTHFNFSGTADGYSSRFFAVIGLPLFILAMQLICFFALRFDPKKQNIAPKLVQLTLWICPVVSLFVCAAVDLTALGFSFNVSRVGSLLVGLLFVAIGNYLPKCRPNYTMGIRIPWTLADADNWIHTHRFAGYVWSVVGMIVVISTFFSGLSGVLLALLIVSVFLPLVYSFVYAKKHGKI